MFLFLSETNPLFLENKKENWQESLFFKTSFLYRRDFFIPGCMVLWLSDPFFRLEESFRDTGFDQNTVQNSGNKQNFFDGIRELTASLEERFAKVLARDTVLANKPVFWQKFGMRNQSSKRRGNTGLGPFFQTLKGRRWEMGQFSCLYNVTIHGLLQKLYCQVISHFIGLQHHNWNEQ